MHAFSKTRVVILVVARMAKAVERGNTQPVAPSARFQDHHNNSVVCGCWIEQGRYDLELHVAGMRGISI
jgi:hypothetical protein